MNLIAFQPHVDHEETRRRISLVGVHRLHFADKAEKLNHQVFRYPAKFHPPVARALVEAYSRPGGVVLDPFCGSGTTMIEAVVAGRCAIGTDVDPLAVFVSRAKVRRYDIERVRSAVDILTAHLLKMRQADATRWGPFSRDIPEGEFEAAIQPLLAMVPELPRIDHWFRRRVVLQLAAIRHQLEGFVEEDSLTFLRLCFAAIIRNSSNADPVPVSGLEVTKHMRLKEEAGRSVDPYTLFAMAMRKSLDAQAAFQTARQSGRSARAVVADARAPNGAFGGIADAVITSPPYLSAVDYYRRHTLEMYWLGLADTQEARRGILPGYIGRDRVGESTMGSESHERGESTARHWLPKFPDIRPEKERAFRHYATGMARVLDNLADAVRPGGAVVVVVGDVRFCGVAVPMTNLVCELAPDRLRLTERLWYPLANRYMSYSRKNEADIDSDHVLVFRRG